MRTRPTSLKHWSMGSRKYWFVGKPALRTQAIHQQRLDIRLHRLATSGFSATICCQVSSGNSDSVAPAGLGYIAITLPDTLFTKKNAMLMGTSRLSHCASVKRKPASRRIRAGNAPVALAGLPAKEDGAGLAGAHQPPFSRFHQVLVFGRHGRRRTARSAPRSRGAGRTAAALRMR